MTGEDVLGLTFDDRYLVEAIIGTAFAGGTVFRGRDLTTGGSVVVRCPAVPGDLSGPELAAAEERFLSEAERLARVGAASVDVEPLLASGIAVVGRGRLIPYCVFEWLAGRSLERHLEAQRGLGPHSIGEAIAILAPAARALGAAHELGVAHGDVRPANLWLADIAGRTSLKVAAFTLAATFGAGGAGAGAGAGGAGGAGAGARGAGAGAGALAPEYASPEHFKSTYGAIGPASDVYGLALCLVEMISGRRALEGRDATELYLATSDLARRPTPRARGADVSDAVEGVLARALAVDPKRRYANARELWDALVSAIPELTPAPPSVRPGAEAPPASLPPGIATRAEAEPAAAASPEQAPLEQAALEPRPRGAGNARVWLALSAIAVAILAALVSTLAPRPAPVAPTASTSSPADASR